MITTINQETAGDSGSVTNMEGASDLSKNQNMIRHDRHLVLDEVNNALTDAKAGLQKYNMMS